MSIIKKNQKKSGIISSFGVGVDFYKIQKALELEFNDVRI